MRVAEVFGPTIQGEGPSCGQQATFIRLWGCNLDCSWCDTPYTWDVTGKNGTAYARDDESTVLSVEELVELVPSSPTLVVVTGGEPLVQATELAWLAAVLIERGHRVEVETNGTRAPLPTIPSLTYNVSPKLAHADTSKPALRDALRDYRDSTVASFKFVACSADDLDEVAGIVERYDLDPSTVWIMPEGRQATAIVNGLAALVDGVVARGWNLSPRLHVLCWGDKRGV